MLEGTQKGEQKMGNCEVCQATFSAGQWSEVKGLYAAENSDALPPVFTPPAGGADAGGHKMIAQPLPKYSVGVGELL